MKRESKRKYAMLKSKRLLTALCIVSASLMLTGCGSSNGRFVKLTPPANMLTPCAEIALFMDDSMGGVLDAHSVLLDKYQACMVRHGALVKWVEE